MKKFIFAAASLLMVFAVSSSALACACCAEHGYRDMWTGAIDNARLDLLKDMNFGKTAVLYTDEAGFESVRGLNSLEKEYENGGLDNISLVDVFTRNIWKLTLKTPSGKTGTLTLPRPSKISVFRADLHEVEIGAGEAVLYKEFRFNGYVGSGTGFFKSSIARPTSYSLVFQGKGNMCDNAEDFNHWRLEVTGSKASYAFFGKMAVAD